MFSVFLFVLGLVLLLSGSTGVIKNALIISRLTKISPLVIGITLVAIGTSLPEITVSIFGGLEEASNLSLGNIIGSNIANIGLIIAVSLILKGIFVDRTKTQNNMFIMLFISLFFYVTLLINGLTKIHGFIFVLLGFGFITGLIMQGTKEKYSDDLKNDHNEMNSIIVFFIFIISLVALILGGKLLVNGGIEIAQYFKIPESIIGISAVAIGTSLPELAVSIMGLTRGSGQSEEKLVIGNILGSNIFNIFFGAGTLGLFGVKKFDNTLSLNAFLIFTLIFCALLYFFRGRNLPRFIGGFLIIAYTAYLFLLFR